MRPATSACWNEFDNVALVLDYFNRNCWLCVFLAAQDGRISPRRIRLVVARVICNSFAIYSRAEVIMKRELPAPAFPLGEFLSGGDYVIYYGKIAFKHAFEKFLKEALNCFMKLEEAFSCLVFL